jgi:hypothetical protein
LFKFENDLTIIYLSKKEKEEKLKAKQNKTKQGEAKKGEMSRI